MVTIWVSNIGILKDNAKNENTSQSTRNWIKVFQSWAEKRGHHEKIENHAPEELNKLRLEVFYAEVRKQNGENYEPDSLRVMVTSIDRYLRDKGYKVSIVVTVNSPSQNKYSREKPNFYARRERENDHISHKVSLQQRNKSSGHQNNLEIQVPKYLPKLSGGSSHNILGLEDDRNTTA
ncbi:hypothetical protein QZH41_001723 [Actinostola sp. cb2023]|nr:hypothetical protein QZH41_001723 [Actinostola sp. cb2023]